MNLFGMKSFDTSFSFVNLFRKQLLICLTPFMVLVVHNALAMFLLGHVHCCIRKRKNATLFSIWWCQANLSTIDFFYQVFQPGEIFLWKIHVTSTPFSSKILLPSWYFVLFLKKWRLANNDNNLSRPGQGTFEVRFDTTSDSNC